MTLQLHTPALIFILAFAIIHEVDKLRTVVTPILEMRSLKLSMPKVTQPLNGKVGMESGSALNLFRTQGWILQQQQ